MKSARLALYFFILIAGLWSLTHVAGTGGPRGYLMTGEP
jgi:hypothetical protein